jgi:ribonuclease D
VTAVLAAADDAPRVVASLRGARRVAIDTEFHAERRFLPELYLVQVQVDAGPTWILDPLHGDLVAQVAEALLAVPWVVHAGEQDLRVLSAALGGLPERVDDTQIAAGLLSDHFPAPYAALVQEHLGRSLEKGETLSDWSRRPLTPAQLEYSALDVQLLLPLWDALEARLAAAGRLDVARAACDEARRAGADGPDDADAYRQLPAAPTLAPSQLLVLQELAIWRLQRARATNQPVRTVLGDGVLVDLARRQPLSTGALLANRRLPRSLARDAAELVERIGRARERPESAIGPVVRRRTAAWRAAGWIQLWAEHDGAARGFAAGLVLPRTVVERIVVEKPDRDGLRAALGWRDALVGDSLAAALAGNIALNLVDGEVHTSAAPNGDPPPPGSEKIIRLGNE